MKDFDEFPGLTEDELVQMLEGIWEDQGIENEDGVAAIPLQDMPKVLAALSYRMTLASLRKYHEWLHSEGAFDGPTWQTS